MKTYESLVPTHENKILHSTTTNRFELQNRTKTINVHNNNLLEHAEEHSKPFIVIITYKYYSNS